MAEKKYTPMMQHYLKIRRKSDGDFILLFRGFYEMFFTTAKLASQELDLVLDKECRGRRKSTYVWCSF